MTGPTNELTARVADGFVHELAEARAKAIMDTRGQELEDEDMDLKITLHLNGGEANVLGHILKRVLAMSQAGIFQPEENDQ